MTRAARSPVVRVVVGERDRELVVRVEGRSVTIRPLRHKAGGPAEATITWSAVYDRAICVKYKVQAPGRGGRR